MKILEKGKLGEGGTKECPKCKTIFDYDSDDIELYEGLGFCNGTPYFCEERKIRCPYCGHLMNPATSIPPRNGYSHSYCFIFNISGLSNIDIDNDIIRDKIFIYPFFL